MAESCRRSTPDRAFILLLTPLIAASLPSLLYCVLELALRMHGGFTSGTYVVRLPPENVWDRLFALQTLVYQWVARWNSLATLAATAFFVLTLFRPRWRTWRVLALIPYGVLLAADFTMHWRYALLP
jgi:hypothetical protein